VPRGPADGEAAGEDLQSVVAILQNLLDWSLIAPK
jgi:hypothetical protein